MSEQQLTTGPGGRILTNVGVWSPDGKWIVYDTRSDAAGETFDGTRIEAVHVETREIRTLYESKHGANCGVATWHPKEPKVVFILGPENPTADWKYGASRRQGVIVDASKPGVAVNLDARDLVPPFTPGALRGGSHVHVFSPDGERVSFTYEDQYLTKFATETADHDANLRNVGVSVPAGVVKVNRGHPRNHDGGYFSVLITKTTANPKPGSDEIAKAFEEGWIGNRSLAFQGHVVAEKGETISELFVVDLPADLRVPGDGPLQGTETRRPFPPKGTTQRRLTFTAKRKHPGLQGPRHWLRSSPDGSRIAFLMKDDNGVPQLWTIPPTGGEPTQVTRLEAGIASAFTWNPKGGEIAFVTADRVAVADVRTGVVRFVTDGGLSPIRPEACVFSPDGSRVAFVRRAKDENQICMAEVAKP
ncbi:DUF3748 domain-containing protein [Limnoglobus roseus]|uniref:Uncharacterized protein n=1 Tax=Limnoglobus roseus TaxID=2598579 RepID=A0A5C1A7X0_9BACT|nr:DUF3748 domain-containing protein [Limnoglobus roseus]QEL15291.1 hypothetical protein PX52LOC_02206 [Limnoglobus roseus]